MENRSFRGKSYLIVLIVLLFGSFTFAQEKNFIDQNYIEVTGKAELNIVPNEIYISIVLKEDNKEKKTIAKLESELIPTLKSLGVDVEKDLKVITILLLTILLMAWNSLIT